MRVPVWRYNSLRRHLVNNATTHLFRIYDTSAPSQQRRAPRQRLHQILDARPPRHLSPPVLHVRMRHHRLHRHPLQRAPLDRDHRRALPGRTLDPSRLRAQPRMVVLQERHASEGQTDRAGAVHRGGHAALECVAERGRARVKEGAAFFLEHLGDDVGRVDRRGGLVSVASGVTDTRRGGKERRERTG
jgi:hypothetical protein